MSKRSISYGTILGILLTVIVFVIVIIISKNIFSAANYAGRWECKFAYAVASPMGLFSQESAVVQNAATWGTVAIVGAAAIVVGAAAVKGIKTWYREKQFAKGAVDYWKDIFEAEAKAKGWKAFKEVLANQKVKTFLKGATMTGGALAGTYALASVSNSIAENMQKPILDNLCKPKVEGYVDTSDFDDSSVLKSCISDLKREVLNATKIGYIRGLDNDKQKELCLLYPIAKLVIATYGETIGASVRVGYGRLHYVLLVNYTLGKTIYLSDLLAVLDLMGVDQNRSYYDLIYSQGVARAIGEGEFYANYTQSVGGDVRISDQGIAKIMTFYSFMDKNGNTIEKKGDSPGDANILFNRKGEYMVSFIYDGQGAIIISTNGVEI